MVKPAAAPPTPAGDLLFATHPAAAVFPLMDARSFALLIEDIRKNGQLEPIIMLDGVVLDGRNRRRACDIIGVEPFVIEWQGQGTTPVAFIISRNLHRRHLKPSQRAMAAARLASMAHGGDRTSEQGIKIDLALISAQEAADLFDVSRPHVFHARTVIEHGAPEEIRQCDGGEASVSTIANAIRKKKIASGEWQTRSRKKSQPAAMLTAEVVQLHPGKTNHKKGPVLPGDAMPQFVARRAIGMRDEGRSIEAIAKELGIAVPACRQMIDVVLIADRDDLPPRETQLAATALKRMDERSLPLHAVHASLAPIARRLWGDRRVSRNRRELEVARLARFDRGLGVLVQACTNGALIEIPHLSSQRAAEILGELRQAICDIKILSAKIGGIHNEQR